VVIFYRTNDEKGPAHYRSVVTSICVVEEVRRKRDFASVEDFIAYARPRSVFSEAELRERFTADRLYIAKMTYNAAFNRRVTRGRLLDEGVVTTQPRWDMRELTRTQLDSILEMGQVNARLVVD